MRKPNIETQLRTLKRENAALEKGWSADRHAILRLRYDLGRAKVEAREWRDRFDALLARTPIQRDAEAHPVTDHPELNYQATTKGTNK